MSSKTFGYHILLILCRIVLQNCVFNSFSTVKKINKICLPNKYLNYIIENHFFIIELTFRSIKTTNIQNGFSSKQRT